MPYGTFSEVVASTQFTVQSLRKKFVETVKEREEKEFLRPGSGYPATKPLTAAANRVSNGGCKY